MSGNLWMFSDKLDDEDIEILKHEFITYYQGADYYGLGLKVFTRLAHEAGAVYKIGKKVLIRRTIFDAYLRQLYLIDQNKATQPDGCNEAKMKQRYLVRCVLQRLYQYQTSGSRFMYDHDNPILRLADDYTIPAEYFVGREKITSEMLS